jgi:gliding motility-associated-like protein
MVYHVTGISTYGCSESDSLTITTAGNLIIYNGFTPNGDGINDFWDIDNVIYYPNITVEVYNRWGSQVFSSRGYTSEKRWDVTYTGKDVPIGTYYYIIRLNDGSKPITGHVTIVR